jgi:hypothetical protein
MKTNRKQDDENDPLGSIMEVADGITRLAETQGFFCQSPMFRTGTDGLHILRAMNAFLGMKSAELGRLIDKQIGPPSEWN